MARPFHAAWCSAAKLATSGPAAASAGATRCIALDLGKTSAKSGGRKQRPPLEGRAQMSSGRSGGQGLHRFI